MESEVSWHGAKALLEWQLEMGVDEAVLDAPLDRYGLDPKMNSAVPAQPPRTETFAEPAVDPVKVAKEAAAIAGSLEALNDALAAFEHCALKHGARNLVFSDGNPKARVMIVGEAPGREEDQQGRPFVGRAGQLLDRMFAAIGLSRSSDFDEESFYVANVLPWRPPQNRDPKPDEIAMLWPFLEKHIQLVSPDIVVAMGNISCQALLGERGITRLRGKIQNRHGVDILPMFHPAFLLRNPSAKREAWADLLKLKTKLDAT